MVKTVLMNYFRDKPALGAFDRNTRWHDSPASDYRGEGNEDGRRSQFRIVLAVPISDVR